MGDELRGEERISGPYQIPTSKINKRSRIGSIAHLAQDNGWDVYVYECLNYTGDVKQKNGKIKTGKEETYSWTVGKILLDKWYVYKYSDLVCKLNGIWIEYDELRRIISGQESPRDFFTRRQSGLSSEH